MNATRRPLDASAIGLLVLLCACWGFQQSAIKSLAPLIGPVWQVALRSTVAAVLVWMWAYARGQRWSGQRATFAPGVVAGLLFGGEFACIGLGLGFTTASRMSVFLYTAPVFTAIGLHFFVRGETLHARQWIGVLVAFGGTATVFSAGLADPVGSRAWVGDLFGVAAGLLWAATTLVIRRSTLSEAPAALTLVYQLALGGVVGGVLAIALGQPIGWPERPLDIANLAYQIVVVAFASFLVWFWLLRRYLASRLSVFSFLTPMFGVAFGVLLLGEPIGPRFVVGALGVLAGIVLVNAPARTR